MVAKEEMKLFLLFHSEGPEEVSLEKDPQMDEGALVGAWLEAVGMVSMKALVEEWVLVMDISPMKALDMEGPMATSLIMSLVTEATTIEGHPLISTVAMMALAMQEGVTRGMMEATAMEETCQTALNCCYENNCAFYHPSVNGPSCPREPPARPIHTHPYGL
eukprot:bmy_00871T0